MSDNTFDDYLARWRDAAPEHALAWLFLRADERTREVGLACLQQEWLKAIHEIGEAQVAAVKLGWWREEMQRAVAGEARHPLTQALFTDSRIRAVPEACWLAAVDAALLAIVARPAADCTAQRAELAPLAKAFATLEARVAFGTDASDAVASIWGIGLLTTNLRALANEVEHGRSPLPMNLLARHGLTREATGEDGAAQKAAIRDYAGELGRGLAEAAKIGAPLTLLRSVQLRGDLRALVAAATANDPMLALHAPHGGLRDVLKTWRAARISRQQVLNWKPDATN